MDNEKDGKGTSILDTITEGVSSITEAMTGRTQKPRRRKRRSSTTKAAGRSRTATRRRKVKSSAGGKRSGAASSRRATRKSAGSRGEGEATYHKENSFRCCDPQVHTEDRYPQAYWNAHSSEARHLEVQDFQISWEGTQAPLALRRRHGPHRDAL